MLLNCRQLNFGSESQIRCKQYNFGNESQFRCRTHNLATNTNSLQATLISAANHKFAAERPIQQRMLIRCSQLSFGSESQTTQLQQRITHSLQNTQLGIKCYFTTVNSISAANHNFATGHIIRQRIANSL